MDLVQGVLDTLHDPTHSATLEIVQCGPAILSLLISSFSSPVHASVLLTLANEQIQCTPFNLVHRKWLRLYTDASIALALNHADGVKLLDMSIIVAGALGEGRMDCVQELIKRIQGPCDGPVVQTGSPEAVLPFSEDTIPSISPPSLHQYRTNCSHPFILRNHLTWPALQHWRSFEYLLRAAGPGRVVPIERGHSYDQPDWGQGIIPWRDFLDKMSMSNADPPYLAQYNLFQQIPALECDIAIPDYVWSDPDVPHTKPSEPIVNVWIGNGTDGVISPPHTDPYFNCYAQVLGRKRVWLAAPEADVCPYGDSDDLTGYMRNTAPLKVFETPHAGMYATLNPGDLLVFPPRWWHAMKAEGSGMVWSVSIWY